MKESLQQPGNTSVARDSERSFNLRKHQEPLRVLTEAQWAFWKENGYVILPAAVPRHQIDELIRVIWEFEEKDPRDPATWYTPPRREIEMKELVNSGMVELYHHQSLWNNRQTPRVYEAFVDIWGTEKLWVTIDRANLNFPIRPEHDFRGFIHWDVDTSLSPRPVNVQGVLSLTDTTPQTGGFQCVPQLFREFESWVRTQPADRNPWMPDISGYEVVQVETRAGDLLIWDSMLAHGIRPNRSDQPRIAQYISMTPAREHQEALREWRIRSWRDRLPPEGFAFPGDPRGWEKQQPGPAALTELGEKLLGLKNW
jgi:hypothetical protein